MARSYTMRGTESVALAACELAGEYLRWCDPHSRIHDVQKDPRFQHRGIDFLWERASGEVRGVEVKGDRNGRRGTYFFELVSNVERNTPGCFLYTTAEVLLYVFVDRQEVHHLPMPRTREWFLARPEAPRVRRARTRVGLASYTTLGAVVPIRQVADGVSGLRTWKSNGEPAPPA